MGYTFFGGIGRSGTFSLRRRWVGERVLAEHDTGGACLVGAVGILDDLLEAFPPGLGGDFHCLQLVLGVAWVGDALPSKNSSVIVIKSIMTPPLFNRIDN